MHAGFTAAASINVSILISLIALCACVAALLPSALYYLLPQRSLCWAAGLSALKSSKMIVTMMLLLFLHPEQAVSGVKVSRVAITSTVSPPVNASFTSQLADAKLGGTHLTLLWEAATAFDSSEICAPLLHHEREQEAATKTAPAKTTTDRVQRKATTGSVALCADHAYVTFDEAILRGADSSAFKRGAGGIAAKDLSSIEDPTRDLSLESAAGSIPASVCSLACMQAPCRSAETRDKSGEVRALLLLAE